MSEYLAIEVKELYDQGLSQKKIVEKLGCGLNTVRRRMKEMGLPGRSVGSRNWTPNLMAFSTINDEENAYWLGFMMADGSVVSTTNKKVKVNKQRIIKLGLKKADEAHVKKAAKFYNFQNKFTHDNRGGHPRIGFIFNEIKITNSLLSKGWNEFKKKGDPKIASFVPDSLFRHFFRGYFDGDGCISNRRNLRKTWYINIVCQHKNFLEYMTSRVEKITQATSDVRPSGGIWQINYRGEKLKTMLKWMYDGANIYLERKHIRKMEFEGARAFTWKNLLDFEFHFNSDQLQARKDCELILEDFTSLLMSSTWESPTYNIDSELKECGKINIEKNIEKDKIINTSAAGSKIVLHFQPKIWYVRQGNNTSIAQLASSPKTVKKAIRNFAYLPSKKLYPARLIRELLFAGFTRASILSVPVIMAAVKKFGLSGKWFDPCAGWGNRLLAAHLLGLEYEGTDPGICYSGLLKLDNWLKGNAILHNKKWQEVNWPKADFILTSPPFHNKEDYLDDVDYGTFDEWYDSFLKPLIEKSKGYTAVFHVDKRMKGRIEGDFKIEAVPLTSRNRHKAPAEWFVKL